MFKAIAAGSIASLAIANDPHIIGRPFKFLDDDTIAMNQISGLSRMTALTDATYGYPNPPVRG